MDAALAHDYLLVMRGAERTFAAMADCWPDSDIYTLLYDAAGTAGRFEGRRVTPSYLQRMGLRQHNFRRALPLFPRAVESLPVHEHKLVVSSSSAFAHGVRTAPDAVHVCYCHSPFRYVWHERSRARSEMPGPLRPLLGHVLDRVRDWDHSAARRVTHYIANSQTTRRRIQDFYGRDSVVIHPPVDVGRFGAGEPSDYALMVTEIVRHKRIEIALEAARRAGQRIKVVGTGPDLGDLIRRFGDTAEFLGRVPDEQLDRLYMGARVFVMTNVEEFGIAAVEAQAAGRPVLAAAAGGALETVLPGETGVLVAEDDVDGFAQALRYTDFDRFDPTAARRNAARFSTAAFKARLRAEVDRAAGLEAVADEPMLAAA
jgi:glycosyltransferase involved in cell wall biosynthesis